MTKRTAEQIGFYGTAAWQAVRDEAMHRDAFLCVDCKKKGRITPAEEVHHIIPITPSNLNDPSVTLNLTNLVSLCKRCHASRHKRGKQRYAVDEFGRVTILDD